MNLSRRLSFDEAEGESSELKREPRFGLREISRAMDDVQVADHVMADIVRDIDEIAFQSDILGLKGGAAESVKNLQAEAEELRDMAGKLGTLVGALIEAELRGLERRHSLPVLKRANHLNRHLAPRLPST